ncbi:MAG: septum formation initiator family protein [Gammaproteobacteria bacterium]|nr:septum formation initiator family protein [Gammaproteobacteria bacterium]
MRFFAGAGIIVLALLVWQYWFGESGWFAVRDFGREIAQEEQQTAALAERNRRLRAEVLALKEGHAAVEARARTDLGMVRRGETFYQVVEEDGRESERAGPGNQLLR